MEDGRRRQHGRADPAAEADTLVGAESSVQPSLIPIRQLALVAALTCAAAQALSRLAGGSELAHNGPIAAVIGQALWNAAQVGLLLLLLCMWRAERRWWMIGLAVGALASLPVATYAISPGALGFTILMLTACAVAWFRPTQDLAVTIVDAPARGAPLLAKVETLAFVCNLLCSMYNYNASKIVWPHWSSIYERVAHAVGLTASPTEIANAFYTLGIKSVALPAYITPGRDSNSLGALIFLLIWTVLPTLYVLYFAAWAKLAKDSPGTRVQQILCLFCIFHFLFLTDFVAYKFGRGLVNPVGEWCHWSERLAWRIAILLPIYQKVMTRQWLQGNGIIGVAVHYTSIVGALFFLLNPMLTLELPRFVQFATGHHPTFSWQLLGIGQVYHRSLVLMTLLYGLMIVAMRCKVVGTFPLVSDEMATAGNQRLSNPKQGSVPPRSARGY